MNVSTGCSMFKAGAKITGTYEVKLHYDKLKLKIRACCCLKIMKICILPRMTVANVSEAKQMKQCIMKHFLKGRTLYSVNGTASYNHGVLQLILSGDIHPFPAQPPAQL